MDYRHLFLLVIVAVTMALTNGCDSSSDTSGSGSAQAIKSVGVVSSVNNGQSINVNGVTFSAADSEVDNEEGGELDVGMVVTVDGTIVDSTMDEEDQTGTAHKIYYEAEIKGVVIANDVTNSNTLNVMGQTVLVDDMTVYVSELPDYATLESIPVNSYVEVSGLMLMDGTLKATRIKLEFQAYTAGMLLKVKGKITEVGDMYFTINGLTVMYDDNTEFVNLTQEDLMAGICVKVESTQAFDPDAMNLVADSIMSKHHGVDAEQGEKIQLYGEVTSDGVTDNLFVLNDQPVMLTEHTYYIHGTMEDIVKGAMLQVKGRLDENEVLVAEMVKFQKPHNVIVSGIVDAVNAEENYLQVMGAMVYVDSTTWLKDHPQYAPNHPQNPGPVAGDSEMQSFGLADIEAGNFVMVHGAYVLKQVQQEGDQSIQQPTVLASKLQRKKPDHPAQVHVVGPVTSVDSENNILEIAGVKVDTSAFPDITPSVGDKASATGVYDADSMILIAGGVEIEPQE
jgi:hypothetical protein